MQCSLVPVQCNFNMWSSMLNKKRSIHHIYLLLKVRRCLRLYIFVSICTCKISCLHLACMSGLRTRKRSPQRSVVLVVSVPAKNRSSITSNMFISATTNIYQGAMLYCNSPILSSHCKGICNTFTSMCNTFRKMEYCIASMCNVCFLQISAILLKVLRSTLQDTSTTHVSNRPCAGPDIRIIAKSFVFHFSSVEP